MFFPNKTNINNANIIYVNIDSSNDKIVEVNLIIFKNTEVLILRFSHFTRFLGDH